MAAVDLGLKGRAAAVAAASKGLGRASALALAAEGCDVAICAQGEDALRSVAKEIEALGVRAHAMTLDLAEPAACERFVDSTAETFGRLDVVVTNIGGPPSGPTESFGDADLLAVLQRNLMVPVRLARAAVPHMRANGYGRILNITSQAAKEPLDGLVLGNTARSGIGAYMKTYSRELAPEGITINTIAPGAHLTDRTYELSAQRAEREGLDVEVVLRAWNASTPMGRIGDAADFGAIVAFFAGMQTNFITGATLVVDGGSARFVF